MRGSATPIKDVLKTVFEKLESGKTYTREDIEARWEKLVGEAGLKHSRPVVFKKNVLTVYVDTSVWMQELSMQKRKILKGLQKELGKDKISDIVFKIGEF